MKQESDLDAAMHYESGSVSVPTDGAAAESDAPPRTFGMRVMVAVLFLFFLGMGMTAIALGLGPAARVLTLVFTASVVIPALLIGWTATDGWSPPPPLRILAPTSGRRDGRDSEEQVERTVRLSDLLADLPDEKAREVIALGNIEYFSEGKRLAQAGMRGDRIFVIAEGQVELSGVSELGEVTVRVAGPGESFPLAALIGDGTLMSNAVAMTNVELMTVPSADLNALCQSDLQIGARIYKTVAEVLGERYCATLARHMEGISTLTSQRRTSSHV